MAVKVITTWLSIIVAICFKIIEAILRFDILPWKVRIQNARKTS